MFRFPPLTPFVRMMLIALSAIFVLEALLQNFIGVPMFQLFALDPTRLELSTLWQMFTHVLVVPPIPGSLFSLLLSLLFIWWIMAPFEERYGRERVMQIAVVSAVSAAMPALLVGQLMPSYSAFVAGPQTITLAGLCAYAMLLPAHSELNFFGLFRMRPMQLIYLVAGVSVVGFLTTKNAAQLGADLGAVGGSIAFVKLWMQRAPRRRGPKMQKGGLRESGRIRLVKDDDDDPKRWLN